MKLGLRVDRRSSKPIYWQIKEILKAAIERGELKAGDVLPGRSEFSRLLGASRPVVDRAIAELVKEGWLVSIKGKGTFVADNIFSHEISTATFAVVWFRVGTAQMQDNIYWGPLLRGISQAAAKLEVRLTFRYCPVNKIDDFIRSSKVDGIIVLAPLVEDESILLSMWKKRLPFVATSSSFENRDLPCIDTDNYAGVRMVLEHLWELGHEQIAIVNMALTSTDSLRRWEAFQQLMGERGIRLDPRWTVLLPTFPCDSSDEAVDWLKKWFQKIPMPTAIFTATYGMALATLKALHICGISVPEQVSLVGFDDPVSASFLEPPLTTVRQPLEELGRRAIQKLYDALQKGVVPEGTELLQPKLIVRESTAPPRPMGRP